MSIMRYSNRNKLAMISMILGVLYMAYLIYAITSILANPTNDAEVFASGITGLIILPHTLLTFLAVIFNTIGALSNIRSFVLAGAILYAIAMVFMPFLFFYVIVQMILSFVAYSQMRKVLKY